MYEVQPVIHYETTNTSWVRLASVYKEMGIKNNVFHLALHNSDLKFVDPHSDHLSQEEIGMIVAECKINFWYLVREVMRAPQQGADATPIKANRGNISFWWCLHNHITYLLIQIRQTGKSLSAGIWEATLLIVQCINTEINQLTQNETLRSKTMAMVKQILDAVPSYLDTRIKNLDNSNTEMISVRELGNTLKMHLSSSNPKQANKVGRGLTSPWLFTDEFATVENIEIALDAAMPSMLAARDAAKKNGTPYGIGFMTTAGQKNDRDGRYAYDFMMECLPWTESLLDCANEEELHRTIEMNNRGRVRDEDTTDKETATKGKIQIVGEFNHNQLGLSDEWLDEVARVLNLSKDATNRDLFNVWTDATATSPFPSNLAARIRKSKKDPLYNEITQDRFILRWYIEKNDIDRVMSEGQFVMSLDISNASGRDDISVKIRDTETGATIADGTYNMLLLPKFTQWIASMIVKWKNIMTIIENRSQGQYVLDHLIVILLSHNIDPFKRLFNWVVQHRGADPERFAEIDKPMYARDPSVYERYKRFFGFTTSGSGETSRDNLYTNILLHSLEYTGHVMYSPQTIHQTLGLVVRNGRIDHQVGAHDDLVIAWLIGHWYLRHGLNVDWYGHSSRRMLSRIAAKTNQTPEDRYAEYEQQQLREEASQILESLHRERDESIVMLLEQKLRRMDRKIKYEEEDLFSMDALIEEARKTRLRNRRQQPGRNLSRHGMESATSPSNLSGFSNQPLTQRDLMMRR